MASQILGLFTSPQQYQQQQQDLARARAMEYAKLDPFQQANTAIGQGAYGLAGAIGGALGGVDPQLQKITMRQQLASQLNPADLDSFKTTAEAAKNAGDYEFAMAIADAGRQAAIQVAQANKERQMSVAPDIQKAQQAASIAQAIEQYKAMPQTPEIQRTINTLQLQLDFLAPKAEKVPDALQVAKRVSDIKAQLSPDAGVILPPNVRAGLEAELRNLEKQEKSNIIDVGVAEKTREVVYFDKDADQQFVMKPSPTDPTKLVRSPYSGGIDKTTSKVTATATLPGVKEFKDIPELRSKILGVVEPFRKAVNATDNALESLDLSITENNFIGFNAARVQLAKALAGGDLSQKEIAAAGGDPSIFGGLIDMTSTAFTGTPSLDTQNKIKKTINAIRKVALKKGRDEIDAQRNVATKSGFNTDDFSAASDIPEFRPRGKKVPTEVKTFDADKERRYQDWKAKQTGATR
jgi:hypothetical protein